MKFVNLLYAYLVFLVLFIPIRSFGIDIVASIPPIYNLVRGVSEDIPNNISVAIDHQQSPHTYELKAADIRKIRRSGLVFMIDPNFEINLFKAVALIPNQDKRVIHFARQQGLFLLPARTDSVFVEDKNNKRISQTNTKTIKQNFVIDYHIWLNPDNAIKMTEIIADTLSSYDIDNEDKYRSNAKKLIDAIGGSDTLIDKLLKPYRNSGFVVFHDAYQYFERAFYLKAIGTINLDVHNLSGGRSLFNLATAAKDNNAKCIFREPQFSPTSVQRIAKLAGLKESMLDPIGVATDIQGVDFKSNGYIMTMQSIGYNIAKCFQSVEQEQGSAN